MLDGQCPGHRCTDRRRPGTAGPEQEETTTGKAPRLTRATVRRVGVAAGPALLAGLTACSSDDGGDPAAAPSSQRSSTAASPSSPAVVEGPIGAGCALFPADVLGALPATSVATAVGSVPDLSTLAQAVLAANLVDVLNTRSDVTVLAPTNGAFDALGPDALPALLADVPRLTTVLTHHVLPGRLTPDQLVGEHTTLNGDSISVSGPAAAPTATADETVAGAAPATVVCGNVPTANATVYVVDQVLTPAG